MHFTDAIRLDPNNALAYGNRGCAYGIKGNSDNAIRDFDDAIRLDPNYAIAYYDRGLAYSDQRKLDEAIGDYMSAQTDRLLVWRLIRCDAPGLNARSTRWG